MKGLPPRPIAERFWEKVDTSAGPDGCWPWLAYCNPQTGYGQFTIPKSHLPEWGHRTVTAPVVAATLTHGQRPTGLYVLHSCDNRACCNPAHLRWGTAAENCREAWDRGGQLSGEHHHQAKYSDATVAALRASVAGGMSVRAAAEHHGVNVWAAYAWTSKGLRAAA